MKKGLIFDENERLLLEQKHVLYNGTHSDEAVCIIALTNKKIIIINHGTVYQKIDFFVIEIKDVLWENDKICINELRTIQTPFSDSNIQLKHKGGTEYFKLYDSGEFYYKFKDLVQNEYDKYKANKA